LTGNATSTALPESAIRCGEFSESIYQITKKAVSWLLWAKTDNHLYYCLKDNDECWRLSLDDGAVDPILREQLTIIAEHPVTISLAIPDDIPEYRQSVAPSGTQAVFVEERFLSPTPTPSEGEGEGMDIHYDLFAIKNESLTPIYLGRIDGSVDGFKWLPDERKVLITTNPRQSGTASLWIADLDKHELSPLFIVEAGVDEAIFVALSPGGDRILYQQSSNLCLYNIQDHTTRNIVVPPILGRVYCWFLSETQLLIVSDFEEALDFEVAVYDLHSEQLRQISDQILHIHSIELSPDHKYLAVRWAETLALYVLPICYDD